MLVFGCRPDGAGDGVRTHRATCQRTASASAAPDRTGGVDKRDAGILSARDLRNGGASTLCERLGALVAGEVELGSVGPGLLARLRVHLVPVAELVDEPLSLGTGGKVWPGVDQLADLVPADASSLSDVLDELLGDGCRHPLRLLPGRLGEAGLGQLLSRALVLVPLGDLEIGADLVQQAAQKQALYGDAGESEVARWLDPDLLERGRQVVLNVAGRELAERFGPGDSCLASVGERGDGATQFLYRREADRPATEARYENRDSIVGLSPAEAVEYVWQRRAVPCGESGDRIRRPGLQDPVRQVKLEDQWGRPLLTELGQPGGDGGLRHRSQPKLGRAVGWCPARPGQSRMRKWRSLRLRSWQLAPGRGRDWR